MQDSGVTFHARARSVLDSHAQVDKLVKQNEILTKAQQSTIRKTNLATTKADKKAERLERENKVLKGDLEMKDKLV